ncbi:MAG: DUF4238 domain-containing protein [Fuerstiella sp.]
MDDNSKKHHFNPEHILKNFVLEDESRLFVFNKLDGNAFPSTPRDAGHENHFNSITVDGDRHNLESVFQDADTRQSVLIAKIIQSQDLKKLTNDERNYLAQLVILQMLRVKRIRNNIREIPKILREAFEHMGVDQKFAPDIDNNEAKIQSFEMLSECVQYAPFVLTKQWSLIVAPPNHWFWTSDNPICIANGFAASDSGLAAQGSTISWPIAKDLMLRFSCPSIANKVSHSNERDADRAANLLRSEATMICAPAHVEQFNLN